MHSNPEALKINTMSDLSLEVYLAAKTETQLRNYLFKMEGGVARLYHCNDALLKFLLFKAAFIFLYQKAEWEQRHPCPTRSAVVPGPQWGEAVGGNFQVDFHPLTLV